MEGKIIKLEEYCGTLRVTLAVELAGGEHETVTVYLPIVDSVRLCIGQVVTVLLVPQK